MLGLPRAALALTGLLATLLWASPGRAQSTFYEAYGNGLAHEAAGRWEEARESFLRARSLRPAAAMRVKSYGLNFIERYDPDFHLAVVSSRLGHVDEAGRHLRSARAAGVTPEPELARLQKELTELEAARARAAASEAAALRPGPTGSPAATAPASEPGLPEAPAVTVIPPEASTPLPALTPDAGSRKVVPPGLRSATQPAGGPFLAAPERSHGAASDAAPTATAPPPARSAASVPPSPALAAVTIGGAASEPLAARTPSRPGGDGASRPATETLLAAAVLALGAAGALAWWVRRRHGPRPAGPEPPATADGTGPTTGPTVRASTALSRSPAPEAASSPGVTVPGLRPLGRSTDPGFGPYSLDGVLGRGAMGTTYLARRIRDGAVVALKVPHEHILDDPDFTQRFLREGALGAMLHHPNIVRIYEAGEHDGRPFIAMELVPGTTLERLLETEPRLPVPRALHVAREIGLALDYAHLKGVVHRDLKPDNVMVLPDGAVKVMDYGIARQMNVAGLTASNTYLGTPLYSAPEALSPAEVGPASDLYSLGIILYRCLSGSPPFVAATPLELLHKHAFEPLPPFPPELGIPPELFGLLRQLTAKQKADRYQSAEHFVRDLGALQNRL